MSSDSKHEDGPEPTSMFGTLARHKLCGPNLSTSVWIGEASTYYKLVALKSLVISLSKPCMSGSNIQILPNKY